MSWVVKVGSPSRNRTWTVPRATSSGPSSPLSPRAASMRVLACFLPSRGAARPSVVYLSSSNSEVSLFPLSSSKKNLLIICYHSCQKEGHLEIYKIHKVCKKVICLVPIKVDVKSTKKNIYHGSNIHIKAHLKSVKSVRKIH